MAASMTLAQLSDWCHKLTSVMAHYDAQPILEEIRQRTALSVEMNFAGAHTPDMVPWAKRLHTYPHPPLRRTGDMMEAAVTAVETAAVDRNSITISTETLPDYWAFQQEGWLIYPGRAFLGFPEELVEQAVQMIADDLLRQLSL